VKHFKEDFVQPSDNQEDYDKIVLLVNLLIIEYLNKVQAKKSFR